MFFFFASFLLQGVLTRAECPVLQCIPLPPCVSHVVEISPGCPGCPVCGDIAPYTRTDSTVAVQILPDLIVTAPSFVLEQAAQLKKLVDQAQAVYNGLSDPDKAVVDKAVDKAVATALDKLYPPVVPSATKEAAVSNAISQIAVTQPASPILSAIKAIVNNPVNTAPSEPDAPILTAIKAIVNTPSTIATPVGVATIPLPPTPFSPVVVLAPAPKVASTTRTTTAANTAATIATGYGRSSATASSSVPLTRRSPVLPYGPRVYPSRTAVSTSRNNPQQRYVVPRTAGAASSSSTTSTSTTITTPYGPIAAPNMQETLLSTTYYSLDPFVRRNPYRF